jgi:hypothetical protein
MLKILIPALFLAYAAYALARGIGIPHWINWPTAKVPADSCDIAILVFVAVILLYHK